MIAVVAGLFGLVIGNFLNLVIHRVPIRQSVACFQVPILWGAHQESGQLTSFSYLMLRGRGRNCKAHISSRYPLVEGSTRVLFALAAYEFGLSLSLVWALVLISVLVTLAKTDFEYRLLPNAIVGPAAVVGFGLSVARASGGWWIYFASAVAVAAGLFALALAYPGGMGMGGMLWAFLGPYAALTVFVGALAGALVGVGLMVTGAIQRRSTLPFGVFLAFAGVLTLFLGQEVWGWYLRLIREA